MQQNLCYLKGAKTFEYTYNIILFILSHSRIIFIFRVTLNVVLHNNYINIYILEYLILEHTSMLLYILNVFLCNIKTFKHIKFIINIILYNVGDRNYYLVFVKKLTLIFEIIIFNAIVFVKNIKITCFSTYMIIFLQQFIPISGNCFGVLRLNCSVKFSIKLNNLQVHYSLIFIFVMSFTCHVQLF